MHSDPSRPYSTVNSGSAARLRMWLWASMIIDPPSLGHSRPASAAGVEDDDIGWGAAGGPPWRARGRAEAEPRPDNPASIADYTRRTGGVVDMLSFSYTM